MREIGAFTQYIDVAQVLLYVFWIFFVLLVLYLHRESKREGYPLRSSRKGTVTVEGYPSVPKPKTYKLFHGGTVQLPSGKSDDHRELAALDGRAPGDPIQPTGDCMLDGLGAASWVEREDEPDAMLDGSPRIVPMSTLSDEYKVPPKSPDPRGLRVIACDRETVGTVSDIWLDRMELFPRYYSVELTSGKSVLLPVMLSRIVNNSSAPATGSLLTRLTTREKLVQVASLFSHQFNDVPQVVSPVQITLREEDRVSAYYGGGHLHASPERSEPLM